MRVFKLPNAAASTLTITTTATNIYDLIDTAAALAADLPNSLNGIMIIAEDGDIRVLFDGNSPTSTQGILIPQNSMRQFHGVPLTKMELISTTGGNVVASVQVGEVDVDSTF